MMKREISPWFKEKFHLDCTDVEENLSEETSVDEDENEIPSMYVKNVNKRLLSECYVRTKCLDEEVASKHLDELTAYETILEEQRLNHEEKTADILIF